MLPSVLECDQLVLKKFSPLLASIIFPVELLLKFYDDRGALSRGWESRATGKPSSWQSWAQNLYIKGTGAAI